MAGEGGSMSVEEIMQNLMIILSLLSADPPNKINYRPGDVRPIIRDCSQIKIYYTKLPTCTFGSGVRISANGSSGFEDALKRAACAEKADAVIWTHKVGNEVSGIAVRCNVSFLLPSDFRSR
jgi:hypothetical protein